MADEARAKVEAAKGACLDHLAVLARAGFPGSRIIHDSVGRKIGGSSRRATYRGHPKLRAYITGTQRRGDFDEGWTVDEAILEDGRLVAANFGRQGRYSHVIDYGGTDWISAEAVLRQMVEEHSA